MLSSFCFVVDVRLCFRRRHFQCHFQCRHGLRQSLWRDAEDDYGDGDGDMIASWYDCEDCGWGQFVT